MEHVNVAASGWEVKYLFVMSRPPLITLVQHAPNKGVTYHSGIDSSDFMKTHRPANEELEDR